MQEKPLQTSYYDKSLHIMITAEPESLNGQEKRIAIPQLTSVFIYSCPINLRNLEILVVDGLAYMMTVHRLHADQQ